MRLRVRWPFFAILIGVAIWGTTDARRKALRQTEILATTTCPFRGQPVTRVAPGLSFDERAHVTAHETVHIQQCLELGPVRYRLKNLTSKLSLEAPAYCAGAVARLGIGMDSAEVKSRLVDDAVEALRGIADSSSVVTALQAVCPAVLPPRRRDPSRIRA
jgi:hypothetical protein